MFLEELDPSGVYTIWCLALNCETFGVWHSFHFILFLLSCNQLDYLIFLGTRYVR